MKTRTVFGVGALGTLLLFPMLSASASVKGTPTAQEARPAVPQSPSMGQEARTELPRFIWTDFDGDGNLDAFVLRADGSSLLLQHTSSGLIEVQRELGLGSLPALASVSWLDFDRDGRTDLFALTDDGRGILFANRGEEGFLDATALSGLALEGVVEAQWIAAASGAGADLLTLGSTGAALHKNDGAGRFSVLALDSVAYGTSDLPAGFPPLQGDSAVGALPEPAAEAAPAGQFVAADRDTRGTQRSVASGNRSGNALVKPTRAEPVTPAPFLESLLCANSIVDQAVGGCIKASSTPMLGLLHPLSSDFNINPDTNNVGIGITVPGAKLHVLTSDEDALFAIATGEHFGARIRSTATSLPALEVEGAVDAAHFLGGVRLGFDQGITSVFQSRAKLDLDGNDAARMSFQQGDGSNGVLIEAMEAGGDGAQIELWNVNGTSTIQIDADGTTDGADLRLFSSTGTLTAHLEAEEATGNGAQLALSNINGTNTIVLDAHAGSLAGELSMFTSAGVETVEIRSEEAAGNGGQLVLRKADGTVTIVLDAEMGTGGSGRIQTEVLEITGGADLVESFEVHGACDPGTVVVIDGSRPGELAVSSIPYDSRVAGIVSGAGGVRPGLSLGQAGVLGGDTQVALTGRVYVRCSTENGSIRPGDLLTTSATIGHAMRVTDPERAFGSVIGKAMSILEDETGLVLVLVSLQ